jgi:hypothetical protein
MKNTWQPFENGSLPSPEKRVLVYAPSANPQILIARWPGEGREFLISPPHGKEGWLNETITFWMDLPEAP